MYSASRGNPEFCVIFLVETPAVAPFRYLIRQGSQSTSEAAIVTVLIHIGLVERDKENHRFTGNGSNIKVYRRGKAGFGNGNTI